MSGLTWKDAFQTGIDEMDGHHRKFFEYLRDLEEVAGGSRGREVIEQGIAKVGDYIRYHFAEEEKLLAITGYPELAEQKREHAFFIRQVGELRDKYAQGDPYLPVSTLEFLRDWFTHHILETDKKYGGYLSSVKG